MMSVSLGINRSDWNSAGTDINKCIDFIGGLPVRGTPLGVFKNPHASGMIIKGHPYSEI
jgi:hypothetical protein